LLNVVLSSVVQEFRRPQVALGDTHGGLGAL